MKTKRNLIQICLLGAALLALPVAGQAQYAFTTNNGAITITGYSGLGGTVTIPSATNGYPAPTCMARRMKAAVRVVARCSGSIPMALFLRTCIVFRQPLVLFLPTAKALFREPG
jgi:hypothetical protein